MNVLSKIGYHILWLLYYGIIFSIMVFTYIPMEGSNKYSSIGVILSFAALISPFFVSYSLINRFYWGDRKIIHARVWGIVVIVGTLLYTLGIGTRKISTYDYSIIALNISVASSLFGYKSPIQESKIEPIEFNKQ